MITYATRYHETVLPLAGDPLLLVTGLARHSGLEPYAVHENGDEWFFAGGCLTGIRITRERSEIRHGTRVRQLPSGSYTLDAVERFIESVASRGWRAYGRVDGHDLLHLFVPEVEVRVTGDEVLIRSVDERDLIRTVELLRDVHSVGEERGAGERAVAAPAAVSRGCP